MPERFMKTKNAALALVLATAAFTVDPCSADVVTDWNQVTLNAIRTQRATPQIASRALAMVHVAMYDAVNGITHTHTPYLVSSKAPGVASIEAAALAAARDTLNSLFPTQQVTFEAAYQQSLSGIRNGKPKTAGLAWGSSVAAAVIAARANDGAFVTVPYTPGTNAGDWQPTPPAFAPALHPNWPWVTPFALESGDQFRPPPPPALTGAQWAFDFNQVKELGALNSATRTAEQTEIGRFWIDGPGTATPPGHFNVIAQVVSAEAGLSLPENARLFALLNMAMADAGIAAWDAKYVYNFWRPITAIRAGDTDGNADTLADPAWTPLVPTPNHPDYLSGHATFSMAGATAMAGFFGTDNIPFTIPSESLPGVTRSFTSFSKAAEESGWSRIFIGIHFWSAVREGWATGAEVGQLVVDNYLRDRPGRSKRGH